MFRNSGFSPQPISGRFYTESAFSTCENSEQAEKLPLVLIVDDDGDSSYLLEHLLSQYICEVSVETEGHSALQQIQTLQPDLVLLDIWLPGIDGIEIARVLRKNSATQSIPIIAVTALAREQDRRNILRAGCTEYISKPYNLEDMETILSSYLKSQTVDA